MNLVNGPAAPGVGCRGWWGLEGVSDEDRVGRVSERILAIDPGTTQSGWAEWESGTLHWCGINDNKDVLTRCWLAVRDCPLSVLVIEQVESYGMIVGRDVFETIRWSGRFEEAALGRERSAIYLPRREVKLALCNDSRAKDKNIRAALLEKFGPLPTKKTGPVPHWGIHRPKSHIWSAVALAVTYEFLRDRDPARLEERV